MYNLSEDQFWSVLKLSRSDTQYQTKPDGQGY